MTVQRADKCELLKSKPWFPATARKWARLPAGGGRRRIGGPEVAVNDTTFLMKVTSLLDDALVNVWLFGGWAEELQGLAPARGHRDVDLLYPAQDFDRVDALIRTEPVLVEIVAKRFAHKRAFLLDGVMVELFLVRADADGYCTDLPGGVTHRWPADVFDERQLGMRVASVAALAGYRRMVERRPSGPESS